MGAKGTVQIYHSRNRCQHTGSCLTKTDLGDEQATVLSVCQDAHQRKGGVRREDEVSTAVGGLQGSQREFSLWHAQHGPKMPALQDACCNAMLTWAAADALCQHSVANLAQAAQDR